GLLVEVPLDLRCSQKLLDPFRFVESLVDAESNLRCELEVNAPRDLAAQEFLVALECAEHFALVASAERHHVDGREPQVGGEPHLRNRDQMALEHRVMHVAAREQFGQRMPDELADAKLALRRLLHWSWSFRRGLLPTL